MSPNALDALMQGMSLGWLMTMEAMQMVISLLAMVWIMIWLFGLLFLCGEKLLHPERQLRQAEPEPVRESHNILLWRGR